MIVRTWQISRSAVPELSHYYFTMDKPVFLSISVEMWNSKNLSLFLAGIQFQDSLDRRSLCPVDDAG